MKKDQEEKALHDYTMYTLLEADFSKIPDAVHDAMMNIQKIIGMRLASEEIQRRKKDPSYVRDDSQIET